MKDNELEKEQDNLTEWFNWGLDDEPVNIDDLYIEHGGEG